VAGVGMVALPDKDMQLALESSGRRTQFLQCMVQFVNTIGKPIQLLYYLPYHRKYNPIERCWG
jgi:hypothetical protein